MNLLVAYFQCDFLQSFVILPIFQHAWIVMSILGERGEMVQKQHKSCF